MGPRGQRSPAAAAAGEGPALPSRRRRRPGQDPRAGTAPSGRDFGGRDCAGGDLGGRDSTGGRSHEPGRSVRGGLRGRGGSHRELLCPGVVLGSGDPALESSPQVQAVSNASLTVSQYHRKFAEEEAM